MSLRLKLYALGNRLTLKPLFARVKDPARDGARIDRLAAMAGGHPPLTLHLPRPLGGRPGHWIAGPQTDATRVILYFHGGAYFAGSGITHGPMLARLSHYAGVPVFAQDYRLLQDAPFPAAHDDALAAWDDLIGRGWSPDRIVLGGDSAGGGLMLALLATLCGRGTPPAGAFALSPWTDLSLSGESIARNARADAVLPAHRMTEAAAAYLDGASADDPRASPLFAEFPAPPPVLLQVGSPEILEDDTYRMANRLRDAGGEVQVETWDGAPHGWHMGAAWVPEARAALRRVGTFVQTSFDSASR